MIVNVHEAKTHLSRLLDMVRAGQEIVLAKAGKPYARLVPIDEKPIVRKPGGLKLSIPESVFFDPLPDEELDAWEGR
jgi:prevent-host-death family protein